jgi:hypothetical protein
MQRGGVRLALALALCHAPAAVALHTIADRVVAATPNGAVTDSEVVRLAQVSQSAGDDLAVTAAVNTPPTVSLTTPIGGTVLASPGSVHLTASASDTDGTVTKVELYRATALIATITAAPYIYDDIGLAPGTYSYTAKAYDDAGAVTTSTAVSVRVNAPPTVSITAPVGGTVLAPLGSVNLTASAADPDGTIAKVELYRDGTLIATKTAAPYTFADSALASGTYAYTTQAYDNNAGVTTSGPVSVRVNALPSVAITAPANASVVAPPGSAALSAAAADSDGTIAKVEFYRNAALIATVTAAPYTFTNSGLATGSYSFTAKAYDNNGGLMTSAAVNVRVNALPTVAITAPVNGTVVAPPGNVNLAVTAGDTDGTIGKVEVYRGTTLIATLAAAPYTFTDIALAPGTYSYTAKAYDNDDGVKTSAAISVRVNALPTVTLTAPLNGAVVPPPGSVSVTAAAADSDGAIAKLELYRDTTLIATLTAVPYTFTNTGLASGTYAFSAKAYDNNGGVTTSSVVSVRVNALPTVAITAPAGGTVVPPPGSVPLAVSASDTDGSLIKVELYRGPTLIATLAAAPYNFTDTGVASGTYSYTAKAYDNNGGVVTSAALSVRVNALPTVSITAPANNTVLPPPGSAALTASPADSDGTIGKLEFYRDGVLIATKTAAPYTFTDSALASGSYVYTARAYDSNDGITTSPPISLRVNALPSVAITSPASGVVLPAPGSVSLSASATDTDGTIAKVEFYRGTTLIATVATAPFAFTNTALPAATYTFTAKSYDNNGGVTASAPVSVKVNAAPSVALTAPATGTVVSPAGIVALTATAVDTDGSIAKVEFYRGTTLIGTITAPPYSYTDSGGAAGTYSYTAKAYDDNGAVTSSAAVSVRIDAPPSIAITTPASNTVLAPPGSVVLSAAASDTDGTVTKVELYRDITLLKTFTAAPYTFTDGARPSGTYVYTAKAYDNNGGITTSVPISVRVNTLPGIAISTPLNGAVLPPPGKVDLVTIATDVDGTPAKVEIYRGTVLIATLAGAPFAFSDSGLAPGNYTYTAKVYDNDNAVTASAPVSIRVNALPTVAITAPAGATVVQPPGIVNVIAAAADSDGTVVKVEIYRGSVLIATLASAPYSFSDNALAPGTYGYTARAYDNDGAVASSAVVNVVVNALPAVAIVAPAAGSILPPPASVALAATAADSDGTITRVELYRGSTLIATMTAPPYNFTDSALTSGIYSYTAKVYDNSGGAATSAPVDIRVNALPTAAVTAPADGSFAEPPGTFTLTAAAADSDGTVNKVELYRGGTLIASFPTAPYSVTERDLPAGTYVYTAKAYDNDGGIGISATVTMTVSHNLTPSVAISAPGTVVQASTSFTVTASASDSDGSIAKVEFYRGNALIGTSTNAPYSVDQSGLAPATLTYSAIATDNRGATATSDPVTVIVNAQPTVALTAPANNSTFPAMSTLTLSATAADSDGTVTRVEFYNGATLLGQSTVAPFQLSVANIAAGPYVLYARAVDNAGGATLSASVYVTVSGNAAPATVIYQYDELGRLIGIQPQ